MTDVLTAALEYAQAGWHVFPVRGKRPALDHVEHWSDESTTDPQQIAAWYAGSSGLGIGLDLRKSRLAVVDGDHLDEISDELRQLLDSSGAWEHRGNPQRKSWLFAENGHPIPQAQHRWGEVKAAGGYIVLAPSPHDVGGKYAWLSKPGDVPPVMPVGIEALIAPVVKDAPAGTVWDGEPASADEKYQAGRTLSRLVTRLRGTTENRNIELNKVSLILGHYVPHILDEQTVRDALEDACQRNGLVSDDGLASVRATINSGLRKGMSEPQRPEVVGFDEEALLEDDYEPMPRDEQLERLIDREYLRLKARRAATERLDFEDLSEVRDARERQSLEVFLDKPKITPILNDVLAPEMNLLGGPSGEGKSLLARDWAMHVAAGIPWQGHAVPERRNVLWVASEGLHDTDIRWGGHPLKDQVAGRIWMLDAVDLTSKADVDWLLAEYADLQPGLIVFDVIYGMGMQDDNGTKDALPVINSMKRISAEWGAATLALGHPPHSGGRRFRGASMWRQLSYCEWHMADGLVTCEKSKIANAYQMRLNYVAEYPALRWLNRQEARSEADTRTMLIDIDIERDPDASDRARAERLAPALGVGVSQARRLIARHRETS